MPPSPTDLTYHLRQYDEPYRSTVHLAKFIRDRGVGCFEDSVIDFACGAGANLYWFSRWGLLGAAKVVGIDQDPALLEIARARNPGAAFLQNDITSTIWGASYTLSIQTLSFLEDWRGALQHMLLHTARWCFVSSLFWDGIETHTHVGGKHYNVIDAHSFAEFAKRQKAKEIVWADLVVDKELAAETGKMGTYTKKGMQFSGPLLMPWRFCGIRMA